MAMRDGSLLIHTPTAAATARTTVTHGQLRHLVSCPQRRGIVYYVSEYSILERDLLNPATPPRSIIKLDYPPTCFAIAAHPSNPNAVLLAAGGLQSNIHISLHALSQPSPAAPHPSSKILWFHDSFNRGVGDIVNYMFFSPAELTDGTSLPRATPAACSSSSSVSVNLTTCNLRLLVCGNDTSVRFYDVALHTQARDDLRLQLCGELRLDTCANHASISPDGRTLLCAGDTPHAYLYRIIPGASLAFELLAKYTIPLPPPAGIRSVGSEDSWTRTNPTQMTGRAAMTTLSVPAPSQISNIISTPVNAFQFPTHIHQTSTPPTSYTLGTTHVFPLAQPLMAPRACFTTAWTSDGHKFAIAAQEGALAVWDVRSSVPVWVFWTGVRSWSPRGTSTAANLGDSDGSWEWTDSGVGDEGGWGIASMGAPGITTTLNGSADVETAAGVGTVPVPSSVNFTRPEVATLPITTPVNISNSHGTYTSNLPGLTGAHVDPTQLMLGVVRTRVDPRLPVQIYTETRSDTNTFGPSGPLHGIRNVRFSAGEEGRELCVFVEHAKYIHVIDARTFDPETHRVFVFPNAKDVVAELAKRNEDGSAEGACDTVQNISTDSGTTAQGIAHVPHGAESGSGIPSEQDTEGEQQQREPPERARAEMVWTLMPEEDRQQARGEREGRGNAPSVVDNAMAESTMEPETSLRRPRSPVSVLGPDSATASVQRTLRGRERGVSGPVMAPNRSRSRSRVRYQADYDPPGMRSNSRSPPLVVPFPRFRSRSRESASPITIIRRSSGPVVTLRSASRSRSRSPQNPTSSPPPDSRATPSSSLEPAPAPSPDQVALSALRGHTQRRQAESSAHVVMQETRGLSEWMQAWPTQDWRESRERVVNVSESEGRRSVAVEGLNPGRRSGGASEDLSRSASQNWNSWVGRTWNNNGSRITSGPSGSGGRTQVTAEGVVEFLDADGDIVPRESEEHEHEPQNQAQNRNRNRLRDPLEYHPQHESTNTTSGPLPPAGIRYMQPALRPSPSSPFRPSPRVTPPPQSPHTLQASSTAPALSSVTESTVPRQSHEPEIDGVCFDPTGEWVYVSGKGGIVEWRVREREEGRGTGVGGWL